MLIRLSDVITSKMAGEVDTGHYKGVIDIPFITYDGANVKLPNGIKITMDITKSDEKSVRLDGSLDTVLSMTCSRCNAPLDYSLTLEFEKVMTQGKAEETGEEEFEGILQGDMLDIKALALNEIILNYPMKVLCTSTCKGICQTCGMNLNDDSCTCEKDDIDPRWLGLKNLYDEKFKEV